MIDPCFPPQQFKAPSYSPLIIVNQLSMEDKDSLWLHLKEYHLKKVKFLVTAMSGPFVKMIMDKKNGLSQVNTKATLDGLL